MVAPKRRALRRPGTLAKRNEAGEIIETIDSSLLDVVDNVLNKGVVIRGEVMLGVAGVDLIYLRLSAVLCAADRIYPRSDKDKG
jgi:hypothetical protein